MKSLNEPSPSSQPKTNYVGLYKSQFFATAAASLCAFSKGTVMSFTSPVMEEMQRTFSLSDQTWSLVISISMFGAIFGCLAGGAASNRFGRKVSLILMSTICVVGWLVLLCAQHVSMLYIGRFICGFSIAMGSITAPVYITEISSPEIRGALGSCYVLFSSIGVLFTNILGTYVTWRILALASMAGPAVQTVMLLLVPETPIWLSSKNNKDDVVAVSLTWLRRPDKPTDLGSDSNLTTTDSTLTTLKSLLKPALLKPFAILGMMVLITQFSGIGAVISYSVSIFQSATSAIDANLSAIIVAASLMASHIPTFFLVDRAGRRILLLVSGTFMAVGLIPLGTYYYLQESNADSVVNITWLPVTSLVVFTLAYGIGFGPMPWLMMGELFPDRVRGLASTIVATFNWTWMLIGSKTYVDMLESMHGYGVFWFYGAVALFGVFFTYFFVPETKGLSISEIEEHFVGSGLLYARKGRSASYNSVDTGNRKVEGLPEHKDIV